MLWRNATKGWDNRLNGGRLFSSTPALLRGVLTLHLQYTMKFVILNPLSKTFAARREPSPFKNRRWRFSANVRLSIFEVRDY